MTVSRVGEHAGWYVVAAIDFCLKTTCILHSCRLRGPMCLGLGGVFLCEYVYGRDITSQSIAKLASYSNQYSNFHVNCMANRPSFCGERATLADSTRSGQCAQTKSSVGNRPVILGDSLTSNPITLQQRPDS